MSVRLLTPLLMVALASYFVPLVSPLIASNTLSLDLPSTINTQLTSLAAAVLALLVFRRVTFYPGARAFAFIVPAFSTAFGVAAVALLVSRISYSGSMLLAGYLASVSVTFLLGYFNQHDEPQRMYYVPAGKTAAWTFWQAAGTTGHSGAGSNWGLIETDVHLPATCMIRFILCAIIGRWRSSAVTSNPATN
jgi:uncharacterized membrane protein YccC